MISLFDSDAQRKRCVVERLDGADWVPLLRARCWLLALYHAQPLQTYRIRDDEGVLITVVDGQLIEGDA